MLQHYDDDSTPEYGLLNLFLVSLALLAMIAATTWLFAFTRDGEPYEALTEAPSANRVSLYSKPPDKEIVLLVSLPSALEPRVNVNVHLGATLDANVTPISVTVRLGYGGQHTLRWDSAVERLPPGTCNLYAFPSYTPAASSDPVVASGSELATLRSLVRGLATAKAVEARAGDPSDAMKVADSSGARLVHGLLIANNADAVTLAVEMLELRPALLPIAHVEGPFEGENCLHVLAVNRRQGEMLRLLALATAHLDDEGLRQLLLTPATGSFFTSEPMRSYGGTAFGYACAFRAKRVLNHILDEPRLAALVDLRRPQPNACPISGFLPLHVCVANGRPDVFDLLVARGAHPSETTVHRSKQVTDLDLTPLQLACRLGDHEMTEHILDSRLRIQWVWGPVTSYMLPLDEIEDRGGSHDLMELMLAPDASAQTRRMLLDGFMSGFLWNLFLQKWQRFGRSLHVALRMIDLLSLALLFGLGISLKERPLEADRLLLPVLGGIACACQLLYEVINAALWYRDKMHIPPAAARKISAHALSVLACMSVLFNTHAPSADGQGDEISWGLISVALFVEMMLFISVIFVTSKMGIFALVVERLIVTDVRDFLTFFFLYLTCFWATMFVNYPRAGVSEVSLVPPFNNLRDSFEAMLNVGIAGIHFDIDFSADDTPTLALGNSGESAEVTWSHNLRFVNLVLFTGFYYCCMLFLVILLLRILMAMLSATYAQVRINSELEWRLQYGRHILHLQLMAKSLGLSTNSGELIDGMWAHVFRAHTPYSNDDDDDDDAPLGTPEASKRSLSRKPSSNAELSAARSRKGNNQLGALIANASSGSLAA